MKFPKIPISFSLSKRREDIKKSIALRLPIEKLWRLIKPKKK